MPEKAKVPAIRFKGFTDAWEQRKFKELAQIRRGLTYNPTNVRKDGVRVLRSSNINEDTFVLKDDDVFVELKAANIDFVKENDILITSANGSNRLVGKHALVKNACKKAVHGGFMLLATAEEPEFTNSLMSSPWYEQFINVYVAGGNGAIGNLSKNDLEEQSVFVPIILEQKKIGEFFASLDNLITLHQRKLLKLKNVKKAMLEKMFPKNGNTVPEIRFAGFTDAWEQRKLKEIADKVVEKNVKLEFTETFTNSAEFGIISQRDYFDHDISNADNLGSYYVVRNQDFVYNPRISTFAPVGPINRNKLGRNGVMSPLYTVFRTHDIDNTFLEQYFRSIYWHSFMKLNGDSGARADRFSIKDSVLIEMPIPYPGLKEQLKIGEYLTQLDDLVTLHQRKYEKLQNLKKACLEKMFV